MFAEPEHVPLQPVVLAADGGRRLHLAETHVPALRVLRHARHYGGREAQTGPLSRLSVATEEEAGLLH